eukprot:825868-Prymnesium_polylepis.1
MLHKQALLGVGALAALVTAGGQHPTCHTCVAMTVRNLFGDLGAFAPYAPAPAPAPPPPPPDLSAVEEAEQVRRRGQQRAQQEQEGRARRRSSARARLQSVRRPRSESGKRRSGVRRNLLSSLHREADGIPPVRC